MDIIKRGKVPTEQRYEGTCENCGSKMEANRREVSESWIEGGDEPTWWAVCPVCQAQFQLFPKKVGKPKVRGGRHGGKGPEKGRGRDK